ncbi:translation initiation factor IF-3 [Micrococcales bacterium 31B]|nr:translation initiation factor IF-3 [Micrococcales bacterium 31B]
MSEPRINNQIRVSEVRLVGPNGEQVGIVRLEQALHLANEADLDLVEVAPDSRPPVCKLMDYGKFKYEAAMKAREARKNQANTVLKEIRLRLKIDDHDYETKKGHVVRFLDAGDKCKVIIMFRGREQSRPEMGLRLLQRMAEEIQEHGFVESSPRLDGRNMIMVLGPHKKKADARAEKRKGDMTRDEVKALKAEQRAERAASQGAPSRPAASSPAVAPAAGAVEAEPSVPRVAPATAPSRPAQASRSEQAPRPSQSSRPATAQSSAPRAATAPRPAQASRPAAAPRPAQAPRPAAEAPAPAPRPAVMPKPAGAAKPVPAPKPVAAKPAAKPAAAKPAAKPAAAKPAAKPASTEA